MFVLEFQQEESCDCPVCNLVESYTELIKESQPVTNEVLEGILRELILEVEEANYVEGYKAGYKDALQHDIEIKQKAITSLEEVEYCGECDEECNCEI